MNSLIPSTCALLLLGFLLAAPCSAAEPPETLEACFQRPAPPHPRLFVPKAEEDALKAKIDSQPQLQQILDFINATSDGIQDVDTLKGTMQGRRMQDATTTLKRMSYLALSYRLTGNPAYVKRAEADMLAMSALEDWNPAHFLDTAETTAGLAMAYDWMYDALAPETRQSVRKAIVEKGLQRSLTWDWWWSTDNNWNQVCHGGLVLGALAVMEDEPELAKQIVARAIENLPHAMDEYKPDGGYPEGPGYWQYGTTFNILLISALNSVFDNDFGLASHDGFMKTPEFYLHATGPTGLYFNFSDCGPRGGVSSAMYWFAARKNDPSLLWNEAKELDHFVKTQTPDPVGSSNRLLPFLLIWAQSPVIPAMPEQLHWHGAGRTPAAMMRNGWNEDAIYVAVKGGSPGTNHAHMDSGAFVLDAQGVRWAMDLGSQSYHSLESKGVDLWNKTQNSQRWSIFRINNFSHNTLIFDGQLQRVDGNAPLVDFEADGASAHAILDLTPVYKEQIARAIRGVRLEKGAVIIQDEVSAMNKSTSVRWAMATQAEVSIEGNSATLTQAGRTLSFRVLSPPEVQLVTYEAENPPQEYDAKNPGTRLIGFELILEPEENRTLTVLMQPGDTQSETPNVTPLKNW